MVKVYYCSNCKKIYYISGNKKIECKSCGRICIKLEKGYTEYTSMESRARREYLENY